MNREPDFSWKEALLPAVLIAGLAAVFALDVGTPESMPAAEGLEHLVTRLAAAVATGAEFVAVLVITVGVLFGVVGWVSSLKPGADEAVLPTARIRLGRMLVFALEMTIASDILRTAISPSRASLATLAAIVLLRTLLTHFLEREIREHGGTA